MHQVKDVQLRACARVCPSGKSRRSRHLLCASLKSVPECTIRIQRRSALLAAPAVSLSWLIIALSAKAAQLDQVSNPLPKGYPDTARKLVKGLQETIELELTGAAEAKVRRAASEKKVPELVKEFISRWQNDDRLQLEPSHEQIREAVAELGEYYLKNGQRKPLTKEVSDSVLSHLQAAEAVLPPEEKQKLLGIF